LRCHHAHLRYAYIIYVILLNYLLISN